MTVAAHQETLSFQTEVKELLHLMVHSLYSNKEIFLRELISNSSDALDKIRFEGLANAKLLEEDPELQVKIYFDKDNKTISIHDNGNGMNRDDVIQHLGTIAKSGTKEYLKKLTGDKSKDANLIGQFGVGFYSSFIVADKVTVRSRKAGEDADCGVQWASAGQGDYTIESIEKQQRGTEVTLHLKDDCASEFADAFRLRSIITKYSDHISFPVLMEKPPELDEEGKEVEAQTKELEAVNRATALWTRSKNEITDDEYKELYKHIAHDYQDPLLWTHNRVEGKNEYISLLYIPTQAPFDLWNRDTRHGVKLYVQRVFIMDDAENFLPSYLRFVRGIIDCSDLPLNISREILQKNRLVDTIRNASVKKILTTLEKLSDKDQEKYAKFWEQFGEVLKEGAAEDYVNKEQIAKLLRFASTNQPNDKQEISFADYIGRMKENQDKIYYITAASYTAAVSSPHLEMFQDKGIEVLLLSDRVDEWLVSHLTEVDGKTLQSVAKGELDLGDIQDKEVKEQEEKAAKELQPLLERMQKVLEGKVKEVRVTSRLTSSPACVVADEQDMGSQMQRILKAAGQTMPESQPIFELNPNHDIIKSMDEEQDEDRFADWTLLLFDQAILADGGQLAEPAKFVTRFNKYMLELSQKV